MGSAVKILNNNFRSYFEYFAQSVPFGIEFEFIYYAQGSNGATDNADLRKLIGVTILSLVDDTGQITRIQFLKSQPLAF